MTTEEAFEEYGDEPLFFSHYYNFIFVYKSARLDKGDPIFLLLGGNMEKVAALVVDIEDPLTLNEKADVDYAYIKNAAKQVTWKDGEQE